MVNHQLEDAKVKMIDGRYYVENSVVATYINSRFLLGQSAAGDAVYVANGRISDCS